MKHTHAIQKFCGPEANEEYREEERERVINNS